MNYWSYYDCMGSDPFQSGGVYERLKNNIPQTKPEPQDLLMTEALEKARQLIDTAFIQSALVPQERVGSI